jgi:glycosyltransferase involved in cell wall biosynthesis
MNSSLPVISIILPTYNRAKTISRAINSLLEQTYQDYEIIIVDDASEDETKEIVKGFADEKIRYIQCKQNKGRGAARNLGIQESRGKFIAFQDSDDEWLPKKLEKQIKVFFTAEPELGVVYSDMTRITKDGTEKYYKSPIIQQDRIIDPDTKYYAVYGIGIQSTLIRKECFERAGCFNENFLRFEDAELFIRLSQYYRFHHLSEALVKYYESPWLPSDWDKYIHARESLLTLYAQEIKHEKGFLLREYLCLGFYHTKKTFFYLKMAFLKGLNLNK